MMTGSHKHGASAGVLAVFAMLMVAMPRAAEAQIAVVDVQTIMREASAATEVRENFLELEEKRQAEIEAERDAIAKAFEALAAERSEMSDAEYDTRLSELSDRAVASDAAAISRRAGLDDALNAALKKIADALEGVVDDVASELGIAIVVPRSSTIGNPTVPDITVEVLTRLNEIFPTVTLEDSTSNDPVSALLGVADLAVGFAPDPHVVPVTAGGPNPAAAFDDACPGYINNEVADVGIRYTAGASHLGIYVVGSVDTTLLIVDPAGEVFCNDDFNGTGGQNPGLVFEKPADGLYLIWVGIYDVDKRGAQVEMQISEIGAPWDSQ